MHDQISEVDALATKLIAEHHTTQQHAQSATGGGITNICAAYAKVSPILKLVMKLVGIFKPKWVQAAQPFFDVLDVSCTTT